MLVGVSHRLTKSSKVYVDREGETSALKKSNVDGVVILGSCGFPQNCSKKVKTNLYDVECCRHRG